MMNRMKLGAKCWGVMTAVTLLSGPTTLVEVAPVQARVMLKPNGSNAMPLRTKSVEGRVSIRGQFATTTTTMTFQNETSSRIEADFLTTLPEGTVVTYFAYWFGDEKVVARVVEKERAAAIYQHITSRMRDPALIEMVGRNTFRARIFPVMPNADLRVEMRFVQVLPSTPDGTSYSFPLAPDEAGKGTLDKLDLQIRVAPDAARTSISNNYKQPAQRQADGSVLTGLNQLNYRADKDFVLKLQRRPQPLRASLYAAPAGGRDGFFALALTANRAIARPRLRISGVRVYGQTPAALPPMKAHKVLWLCGRYRGAGAATVQLEGVGAIPVTFGAARENDNLATRLWASQRIGELSANARNRERVVALSKQFTLPSKWTSWLAVPQAELVRFKQEKMRAELEVLGRRYALEVAEHGQSRTARALKARFRNYAAQVDYTESLESYLNIVLQELRAQRSQENYQSRPNRVRIATLTRQIGRLQKLNGSGSGPDYEAIDLEMRAASEALVREQVEGRGNGRRARRLRQQLVQISQRSPQTSGWNYYLSNAKSQMANQLATQYVAARFDQRDVRATTRLSTQLVRVIGRLEAQSYIAGARRDRAYPRLTDVATKFVDEKNKVRPDAARLSLLEAQMQTLAQQGGISVKPTLQGVQSNWAYRNLAKLGSELADAKYAAQTDAKRVAALESEIARVQTLTKSDPQIFNSNYNFVLLQAMQNEQSAYVSELQRPRPDRAALRRHEERMARLYADTRYTGVYNHWSAPNLPAVDHAKNPLQLPKIAQMRTDLNELDAQLAAQPSAAQRAELQKARQEKIGRLAYATRFHLRLGDPLISIDAPSDCAQVVAVMPDGQVKKLKWNAANKRWEARFDIPSYAGEGAYVITVLVVDKSGARRSMDIKYRVDMTQPSGAGQAQMLAQTKDEPIKLRLEVNAEVGTTRVFALLPWGDKIDLKPMAGDEHRFFALAILPRGYKTAPQVTYVLTDKAHNRTSISVDVTR